MRLTIFSKQPSVDFMGNRWKGFAISIVVIVASISLVLTKGLNLGIDFTGGILMEVHSEQAADLATLRSALGAEHFGEISLQTLGAEHELMIRIQASNADDQAAIIEKVKNILSDKIGGALDYRQIDYVGPTVGQELIEAGIIAVLLSFAAIMIYMWVRFEWQYGAGAILALIHDTIAILGFFALTQYDFGLPAVAALLTVIGYSINDSVVIADRIRENIRRFKKKSMADIINMSVNDTLSRTILTGLTTLLAVVALFIFGGDIIRGFAAALVFGVIVGTHSSIYVCAPSLIYMKLRHDDHLAQG